MYVGEEEEGGGMQRSPAFQRARAIIRAIPSCATGLAEERSMLSVCVLGLVWWFSRRRFLTQRQCMRGTLAVAIWPTFVIDVALSSLAAWHGHHGHRCHCSFAKCFVVFANCPGTCRGCVAEHVSCTGWRSCMRSACSGCNGVGATEEAEGKDRPCLHDDVNGLAFVCKAHWQCCHSCYH